MNIAAILALLIQMGVCGKSEFHAPDGGTLQVVVCPMMAAPQPPAEDTPPPAPEPKKDERQAMG